VPKRVVLIWVRRLNRVFEIERCAGCEQVILSIEGP
jgi:hypothetical protein